MGCGACASNDGSADRERVVGEGEEEDGMRARRRRNRQGGRQSRRCWASPCIWVRVCDGRFIVALPSETEVERSLFALWALATTELRTLPP